MDPEDLHARYRAQARWTESARSQMLAGCEPSFPPRILEIGSGTGAILSWLADLGTDFTAGVDLEHHLNRFASLQDGRSRLVTADGHRLPFASGAFRITCFHFTLMWVHSPSLVLQESVRVTAPGGMVAALAEPDYGGRIDFPEELAPLGRLQAAALRKQGADTRMGRRLRSLFHQAGLTDLFIGVLGGEWRKTGALEIASELDTLKADLTGRVPAQSLENWLKLEHAAWQAGERLLFVPTFYAAGRVPLTA
jgi:SAM-dependent methyltransferase